MRPSTMASGSGRRPGASAAGVFLEVGGEAEFATEFFVSRVLLAGLTVTPDLHWIQHPGGDPTAVSAVVGTIRVELSLP
jgi:carbohydrate-selective porin OprB